MKKHYKSEETHADAVAKTLGHRKPTRVEGQLNSLFRLLKLPYIFVGNGKLMIGRYCPDFKREGFSLLIELHGHGDRPAKSRSEKIKRTKRARRRKEFILSKGYMTLDIDSDELNELDILAKRLIEFDKKFTILKYKDKSNADPSKKKVKV